MDISPSTRVWDEYFYLLSDLPHSSDGSGAVVKSSQRRDSFSTASESIPPIPFPLSLPSLNFIHICLYLPTWPQGSPWPKVEWAQSSFLIISSMFEIIIYHRLSLPSPPFKPSHEPLSALSKIRGLLFHWLLYAGHSHYMCIWIYIYIPK